MGMATGFNTTAPTPYWIVRNSWASTWGEEGYIYLEMAKNTCGLADDATIPDVKVDLSQESSLRQKSDARSCTSRRRYTIRSARGARWLFEVSPLGAVLMLCMAPHFILTVALQPRALLLSS